MEGCPRPLAVVLISHFQTSAGMQLLTKFGPAKTVGTLNLWFSYSQCHLRSAAPA